MLSYSFKTNTLKLSLFLTQFLHEHNRLDLQGLGCFIFSPSAAAELDTKRNTTIYTGNVSFESNPKTKESKELIEYISTQTGKIKALAAADLDSYIESAKQFLNIGKAYTFEGIGTLIKTQPGQFELVATDDSKKINEASVKNNSITERIEEQLSNFGDLLMPTKKNLNLRKPLFVMLALFGIGLAIWGGYTIYKYSKDKKNIGESSDKDKEQQTSIAKLQENDSLINKSKDTLQKNNQPTLSTTGDSTYKFVVEVAQKSRALSRFSHLKNIGVKEVQMETKDSLTFKIFFALKASAADTAKIVDSLRKNYTPSGKIAFVE